MARKLISQAVYEYECDRPSCHQILGEETHRIKWPTGYSPRNQYSLYTVPDYHIRELLELRYCSNMCAMIERDRHAPIIKGVKNGW